ncbi:hypothetical protein [Sedimentibacter sp. MB35-C1]
MKKILSNRYNILFLIFVLLIGALGYRFALTVAKALATKSASLFRPAL